MAYLYQFLSSMLHEQLFQVVVERFLEGSHERLDVLRRTRFPFL
jgi:predicted thioredoxin/glutaredoxin